jgi:hypothetical protein
MWEACAKGDWKVHQTLLAEDYLGFSGLYGRCDKRADVEGVKRRRYSDWTIRDIDFSRVSKDVAILTYVYDCEVREGTTTEHYRNHRVSFTWAKRDGLWVVVFAHDSVLPAQEVPGRAGRGEPKPGTPDEDNAKALQPASRLLEGAPVPGTQKRR